ncbi:siderophore-interacting protein [Saccharopolyspora taberi]
MGTGRRRADAPDYRMHVVEVARSVRLGPNFVRLTFTGESLRRFGAGGFDQRIKVVLPRPGRTVDDVPDGTDWYPRWLAMPDEVRPTIRTYTVREHRPETAELDIDFVLHGTEDGHGGPVSSWAATTGPGDTIALLGPDRPGTGRMWGVEWCPPATSRRLLLAGDETAVPAVAAIVESLPPDARGIVCVEVPASGDEQTWDVPDGVEVRWLVRSGAVPHGQLLEESVARALAELCEPTGPAGAELEDIDVDNASLWEIPEDDPTGDLYGWLAGEAAVIKRLRRLMVNDYGVPRGSVAFMGYWREGRC